MEERSPISESSDIYNKKNIDLLQNNQATLPTTDDDLDLENAIGDVFSNFDFNNLNKNNQSHNSNTDEIQKPQVSHTKELQVVKGEASEKGEDQVSNENPKSNEDQNLEDAIKDIFVDSTNKHDLNLPTTDSDSSKAGAQENLNTSPIKEEEDLDGAINNAFAGFFATSSEKPDEQEVDNENVTESNTLVSQLPIIETPTKNIPAEMSIKNVGASTTNSQADTVTKSPRSGYQTKFNVTPSHISESSLSPVSNNQTSNQLQNDPSESNIVPPDTQTIKQFAEGRGDQSHDDFDLDLEAAIGNALGEALASKDTSSSKVKRIPNTAPNLQTSQTQTLHQPQPRSHAQLQTSTQIQSQSQSQSLSKFDQNNFDDQDLNDLIAQSIQQAMSIAKEESLDSNDMKEAITNAFKSVGASVAPNSHITNDGIHQITRPNNERSNMQNLVDGPKAEVLKSTQSENNQLNLNAVENHTDVTIESEALDLEQLQMNDILRDAFRMALEEPQEKMDIEVIEEQKVVPPAKAIVSNRISHTHKAPVPPLPKFTSSKTDPKHQTDQSSTNNSPLELSKASSLFSNPEMKSQISSVITSLTSKINSGELADLNILSTIRKITDEIASGGSLSDFFKKPDNTIKFSETLSDEFLKSLTIAIRFLRTFQKDGLDELNKSIELIEEMILDFKSETDPNHVEISNDKIEFISAITNSSLTLFFENLSSSKLTPETKNSIDKFIFNSPDYKRKTRIANRERKKKWREENAERNKDNDLRIRVQKKATNKFGETDTSEKLVWVEEEIKKRKAKRSNKQIGEEETGQIDGDLKSEFMEHNEPDVKEVEVIMENRDLIKSIKDVVGHVLNNKENISSAHLIANSVIMGSISERYATTMNVSEINMDAAITKIVKGTLENGVEHYNISNSLLKSKRHLSEIVNSSKRFKPNLDSNGSSFNKLPPIKSLSHSNSAFNKAASPSINKPSLQLPRNSPFISNKTKSTISSNSQSPTLRKPGAFQKPKAFSNSNSTSIGQDRGTSLGFPKLYSASLK
ncbi:uncharacterized protein KGF55_000187 [Candida pseudojiufengensis]|uniref:uncharacterized protein n=1 Tax=Candida pseudojiufengensis TaxID=497109 RepID=UPI002223FAA5|nr:uncharacterized protein KGF55_000187 [Candida pseudojiufengensis]KAI5966778.1 hypothetical protein KGF55_000187 [Candida pseudojiufengensis]